MSDVLDVWRRVLEFAVMLGIISPERAQVVGAGLVEGAEPDRASFAASSGISIDVVERLLALARVMGGVRPTDVRADPLGTEGMRKLVVDLADDVGLADETGLEPPRPVQMVLREVEPPEEVWSFRGPCIVNIGRSQRAHVRLDDERVSGTHAVIEITGLGCRIRDFRSANHTFVNDRKVDECDLADGDVVRIARTRLQVAIRCAPATTWLAPPPAPDPAIPGYTIERLLGRGTQGSVYLACETTRGDRPVVLKVLRLPYGLDEGECTHRVDYFLREASLLASLRHPHVVETFGANRVGHVVYLAMEYLYGGSLAAYVKEGEALPYGVACGFAMQALEGVAAAHARKIVHRDIKPENLLLSEASPRAVLKVCDLGLAKIFVFAGLSHFTQTGAWGGTPLWMAPEQIYDFKYVGPAADVFSLGAVLFRLLTGRTVRPRASDYADVVECIDARIPPVASVKPDVPPRVAAVVDRAVLRAPVERFEDAGAMRDALRAAME